MKLAYVKVFHRNRKIDLKRPLKNGRKIKNSFNKHQFHLRTKYVNSELHDNQSSRFSL